MLAVALHETVVLYPSGFISGKRLALELRLEYLAAGLDWVRLDLCFVLEVLKCL